MSRFRCPAAGDTSGGAILPFLYIVPGLLIRPVFDTIVRLGELPQIMESIPQAHSIDEETETQRGTVTYTKTLSKSGMKLGPEPRAPDVQGRAFILHVAAAGVTASGFTCHGHCSLQGHLEVDFLFLNLISTSVLSWFGALMACDSVNP